MLVAGAGAPATPPPPVGALTTRSPAICGAAGAGAGAAAATAGRLLLGATTACALMSIDFGSGGGTSVGSGANLIESVFADWAGAGIGVADDDAVF